MAVLFVSATCKGGISTLFAVAENLFLQEKSTGSLRTGCDICKRPRPVIVLRAGCFSTCALLRQKNLSESRSLPSLTHTRALKSISQKKKKKRSTLTRLFSEVCFPFYSNIVLKNPVANARKRIAPPITFSMPAQALRKQEEMERQGN